MKTLGHHTCGVEGGEEKVLNDAPFLSGIDRFGNAPFLGIGYYFWDNNLNFAHHWGKSHLKNKYYIVEAGLELTGNTFLDLVGNRSDMLYFVELYETFTNQYQKGAKWPIGKFIQFLRNLSRTDIRYKDIFPWKVMRAIDLQRSNKFKQSSYSFVYKKDNYTNLSPCIVICLYEKNDVILQSKILINQN